MTDIMIDLETLSVCTNAVILTIGAAKFNLGNPIIIDSFYSRITIQSCINVGMVTDKKTIDWWNKQKNTDVYNEALGEDIERINIKIALNNLTTWMGSMSNVRIWANGPSFDCSILGEAYRKCNLPIPWKYWNERDVRTIYDLGGVTKNDVPDDNIHNALEDCYRQITGVNLALSRIHLDQ